MGVCAVGSGLGGFFPVWRFPAQVKAAGDPPRRRSARVKGPTIRSCRNISCHPETFISDGKYIARVARQKKTRRPAKRKGVLESHRGRRTRLGAGIVWTRSSRRFGV